MTSSASPVGVDVKYESIKPQLLAFFEQYWNLHGAVLSAEAAHEQYGIPKEFVTKALTDAEFLSSLEKLGVVFRKEGDWQSVGLTPLQLRVANSLLDLTDSRTEKKKLQDLEVSTQQYQAWMKDPVFKEYLHTRADQLLGDAKHEVQQALRDRTRAGDLKAIEYYNEMLGIYTRPRSNSYGINGNDVSTILVQIIAIIDEEVPDTETKLRISERLHTMISRRNLANEIVMSATPAGNEITSG